MGVKYIFMKSNILVLGFYFLSQILLAQGENLKEYNCFTIVVGKDASDTGMVLVGHNEDDWGDMIINIYKVEPKNHKDGEMIKLICGELIPQVDHTYGYLWWQTPTEKFGDYLVNEHGVSVCSDACMSKEDTASGFIGFYLRRLIVERANCARQGVLIAGNLIEEYGYESSGRTYIIADKNEAWLMSVVQGKRWIAQRVPDHEVAIIPNYYTIQEVDLTDTANFLASKDIIEYAVLRGWYDQTTGVEFNFREVYGDPATNYSMGNIARHWSGLNQLDDKVYNYGEKFPFSFNPGRKISKHDIMTVLSSHYEGTDFETNYSLHKSPHKNMVHRICNHGTKFSLVTEFFNDEDFETDYCVWWAPLNPCIHPYIPVIYEIEDIPLEYQNGDYHEALSSHFDEGSHSKTHNPLSAYSVFYQFNHDIDINYNQNIESVKLWKKKFEKAVSSEFYNALDNDRLLQKLSEGYLKKLIDEEKAMLESD